jgi:hypothetical protein
MGCLRSTTLAPLTRGFSRIVFLKSAHVFIAKTGQGGVPSERELACETDGHCSHSSYEQRPGLIDCVVAIAAEKLGSATYTGLVLLSRVRKFANKSWSGHQDVRAGSGRQRFGIPKRMPLPDISSESAM